MSSSSLIQSILRRSVWTMPALCWLDSCTPPPHLTTLAPPPPHIYPCHTPGIALHLPPPHTAHPTYTHTHTGLVDYFDTHTCLPSPTTTTPVLVAHATLPHTHTHATCLIHDIYNSLLHPHSSAFCGYFFFGPLPPSLETTAHAGSGFLSTVPTRCTPHPPTGLALPHYPLPPIAALSALPFTMVPFTFGSHTTAHTHRTRTLAPTPTPPCLVGCALPYYRLWYGCSCRTVRYLLLPAPILHGFTFLHCADFTTGSTLRLLRFTHTAACSNTLLAFVAAPHTTFHTTPPTILPCLYLHCPAMPILDPSLPLTFPKFFGRPPHTPCTMPGGPSAHPAHPCLCPHHIAPPPQFTRHHTHPMPCTHPLPTHTLDVGSRSQFDLVVVV